MSFLIAARVAGGAANIEATINAILTARFNSEASEGKTIISTSEAGGTVTFAIGESLSPAEVIELAAQALLEFKSNSANWTNPAWYPRRIRRLRASFAKATN